MELIFKNDTHQGDNLFQINFCNLVLQRNKEVTKIVNYMLPQYIKECDHWVFPEYKDILINLPIDDSEECLNAYDSWIDRIDHRFYTKWVWSGIKVKPFDVFYSNFYNKMSDELNLEVKFKPKDVLFRHPLIEPNSKKYEDYDFLIINSRSMSGQYQYSGYEFDAFITKLKKKGYKTIMTNYSATHFDVPVTWDMKMSTLDIASLSVNCKNVIGIHTTPFLVTVNDIAFPKVNKYIMLQNHGLSYNGVIGCREGFVKVYDHITI